MTSGAQYLPGGGAGGVQQWLGVYDAYISVNVDPTNAGRVKLRIPQVFGNTTSGWASPMAPMAFIPKVGTAVQAMFIGGDPTRPVWTANIVVAGAPPVVINAGPPSDDNPGQVGEIWYDSSNGLATWEWNGASWIQYQIGTAAVASGIGLTEPNITGGTITGSKYVVIGTTGEFLGYSGTPAEGNMNISISASSGSDEFGNAYQAGFITYGGSGASIGLLNDPGSGATNIQLQPPAVTQLSDVPQVFSQATGAGGSAETQFLLMSSGATNNRDAAQIQLQAEAGNSSTPAQIQFLFGSAAVVTFTDKGVGSIDDWHDMSGELENGWSIGSGGQARYRLMPDNTVMIHGTNIQTGTITDDTQIWTVPDGYQPTSGVTFNFPAVWTVGTGSTPTGIKTSPFVYVRGGSLQIQGFPSDVIDISFVIRYPLD